MGKLSTATTASEVTYKEYTKRGAGAAIPWVSSIEEYRWRSQVRDLLESSDERRHYFPFKSSKDYGFSQWAHHGKLAQSHVDSYLKNESINTRPQEFSYKNASEWRNQLHRIPYGIPKDHWHVRTFKIAREIDDLEDIECDVYRRDVLDVVRFLLGHKPFKDDLVYAPVRRESEENGRTYTEIHTGDWWWQTQELLPDDSTVVPLLLDSDKTLMTAHGGDLSLWPVYVTIGNLSCAVRKSQTRPGFHLLGLIPMVKTGADSAVSSKVSMELYHQSMRFLLERKF